MIVARVAVETDAVGKDQPAAAADAPDVVEARFAHRLAHGGAAEHDRLDRKQPAGFVDVGGEAPGQAGAVEEDRLLGQPVEPPAGADA